MKNILLRWFVLSIAVWIAAVIVPGIHYDNWKSILAAALVLGVLNTFAKPALRILSLPFIFVTLGFFLLVINAILLLLTAWLVSGFHVAGFWSAVFGSLVISIVSMVLGNPGQRSHLYVERTQTLYSTPRSVPPGKGPVIDV
jgi:putative membrane protein